MDHQGKQVKVSGTRQVGLVYVHTGMGRTQIRPVLHVRTEPN
jgi:hypothetical protein